MNEITLVSPLALPFEEALVPSKFIEHLHLASETEIKRQIWENSNEALRPAVLTSKILLDQRGLRVVFPGRIPKGAKLMQDKAGRELAILVNGKTNKTLKNARVIGKVGKAVEVAATVAVIIVEVAHAISNHDNAKRLKRVELGVDRLLQAHDAELKARLEAIYRHSKELLHNGLDNLTPDDKRELHRLCRELIELRARWRDSFLYRLQKIEKADPHWLDKLFFWRREGAERKARQKKAHEVRAGLPDVQLMHFSLILQMLLSGAADRMQEFRGATLPEECLIWLNVQDFAGERARKISGGNLKEFRPFLHAVQDMTAVWSDCAASAEAGGAIQVVSQRSGADVEGGSIVPDEEESDDFSIAYPEYNGVNIGQHYVLKVHFAKRLGDNLTRHDLLTQFIVRTHSGRSGLLGGGVEIPRESYRIDYDATHESHALAVPLPRLSNGLPGWRHVIEVEMHRPQLNYISDPGRVSRATRLVRC